MRNSISTSRGRLTDIGFPFESVRQQLALQRHLESSMELDLVDASDPTGEQRLTGSAISIIPHVTV